MVFNWSKGKNGKASYSQCGEDLIVAYVLNEYLGIKNPTYLDIGAHHPTFLSNTYYFYEKGCRGVCLEPDPGLFAGVKKYRDRDVCLNVGIGSNPGIAVDFYVMSARTLNTFSKAEAENHARNGKHRIEKVIQVPLVSVNDVMQQHFDPCPNFVSLDTEGFDLTILQAFDFQRFRPEVFCVETLTCQEDGREVKVPEIFNLMNSKEYFEYADSRMNTIFVDKHAWSNRIR